MNSQFNSQTLSSFPISSQFSNTLYSFVEDDDIHTNNNRLEDILNNLFPKDSRTVYESRAQEKLFSPPHSTSNCCLDSSNILNQNISGHPSIYSSADIRSVKNNQVVDTTPLQLQKTYYKNMLLMLSSPDRAKEINAQFDTIAKNDLIMEFEKVNVDQDQSKRRLEFSNDKLKHLYEHLNNQ
jgi:hypothetical protein